MATPYTQETVRHSSIIMNTKLQHRQYGNTVHPGNCHTQRHHHEHKPATHKVWQNCTPRKLSDTAASQFSHEHKPATQSMATLYTQETVRHSSITCSTMNTKLQHTKYGNTVHQGNCQTQWHHMFYHEHKTATQTVWQHRTPRKLSNTATSS